MLIKQKLLVSLIFSLSLGATTKSIAQHYEHGHEEADFEEVVVQATRSKRRIQGGALKVEVLAKEEINEKLLMRPSNISMMLNETGGLRVQVSSPALGSATSEFKVCVAAIPKYWPMGCHCTEAKPHPLDYCRYRRVT